VFQACRGSYEFDGCFRQYRDATHTGSFVVDGLKRGHRFGLLASTDHGIGSSFVGLYAAGLDRQSLFDALYSRRAIGATARGIAVDFRIGDNFMGEEGKASGNAQLEIFASGYRELARIDIVRNGVTVHSVLSEAALPKGWVQARIRVEWKNANYSAPIDWSGRLTITSGEIEQVPYIQREVTTFTKQEVAWSAVAPGFGELYGVQRGGLELTLMGTPDAEVRVVTGPACLTAPLSDLAAGARKVSTVEAGMLALQPGTGGLRSLDERERKISWEDPDPGPAWYYTRVMLVDGEMAWSSPIWLD